MTAEIWIAGSSFVIALVAVSGVVVSWRRNGKSQGARDQEIKDNQKEIINRLDHKETGLSALNTKLHNFEIICASARSEFGQRILGTERDVKDLKRK
jgi:hypothetical protein